MMCLRRNWEALALLCRCATISLGSSRVRLSSLGRRGRIPTLGSVARRRNAPRRRKRQVLLHGSAARRWNAPRRRKRKVLLLMHEARHASRRREQRQFLNRVFYKAYQAFRRREQGQVVSAETQDKEKHSSYPPPLQSRFKNLKNIPLKLAGIISLMRKSSRCRRDLLVKDVISVRLLTGAIGCSVNFWGQLRAMERLARNTRVYRL
mmetsp:Transcript_11328/g.16582  ORF Transcript_11328/g.16582 Transcript_11328/m.16582 type:complete len:207 (-) Transcript_11328:564-1184(-)